MKDFIEQQILTAVRGLLTGRVNEILGESQFPIPFIEFSDYRGGGVVVPVISLTTCERSEKERIIRLDTYSVSISFTLPETPESEWCCYAYAVSVSKALGEEPTLGGIADRAVITGKKYNKPKKAIGGNEWEVVLTLRITVEESGN
jgi:hypothetical protein